MDFVDSSFSGLFFAHILQDGPRRLTSLAVCTPATLAIHLMSALDTEAEVLAAAFVALQAIRFVVF